MTAPELYAARKSAVRQALGTDLVARWRGPGRLSFGSFDGEEGVGTAGGTRGSACDAPSGDAGLLDNLGRPVWAPVDPVAILARHRETLQRILLARFSPGPPSWKTFPTFGTRRLQSGAASFSSDSSPLSRP